MHTTATPTHCPYCALQCGMGLATGPGGVEVVERPGFPVNGGGGWGKGRTTPPGVSTPVGPAPPHKPDHPPRPRAPAPR
ncbi:hypothetical protein ACFWPU_26495, partial [Streptomyces sp. NPDC058471]